MRLKGELYFDESVQKIIDNSVVFIDYVKYPRTYHLPWSQTITKDDRIIDDISVFDDREVVVTEKMDGENTSLYCDYIHARSIDGRNHISRGWVKNFWGKICGDIPNGWRICGENLYAKHSIGYDSLDSYFYGFSVWDERNICLSWDETVEWFDLLDVKCVPVLYEGKFDVDVLKKMSEDMDLDRQEGYVVRVKDSFSYMDFKKSVAKFVRRNHVHTHNHWMNSRIERNGLKNERD